MLSSFFKRRNARLIERLNAAVETVERARESYENHAPRVAIDTSYVDQQQQRQEQSRRGKIAGPRTDSRDQEAEEANQRHEQQDRDRYEREGGHTNGHDFLAESTDPVDSGDDAELIREAVEQLEHADRREAEARAEAEAQRERADILETSIASEQAARREAETQSVRAQRRANELENELEKLRQSAGELEELKGRATEVRLRDEATQQELKDYRHRAEEAEAALAEAEDILNGIETRVEAAEQIAAEAEQELSKLRKAAADAKGSSSRDAEQIARLDAKLKHEESARRDADAKREKAEHAAEALRLEAEKLRAVAKKADDAEIQLKRVTELEELLADEKAAHAEATAGRVSAEKQLAAQRDEVAALQAAVKAAEAKSVSPERYAELEDRLADAQGAKDQAVTRREKAERDLADARAELNKLKDAAKTRGADDEHAKKLAELEAALAKERSAKKDLESSNETALSTAKRLEAELEELKASVDDARKSHGGDSQKLVRVEAKLLNEQTARREAESKLRSAEMDAADLRIKIAALETSGDFDRTDVSEDGDTGRLAAALAEADQLRQRLARIESDVEHEQALRREFESKMEKTELDAADIRNELADLRAKALELEKLRREKGAVSNAELAARSEADSYQRRVADLEREVERERAARLAAEDKLQRAARDDKLAALRSATGPIGRLADVVAANAAAVHDSGRVPLVHFEDSGSGSESNFDDDDPVDEQFEDRSETVDIQTENLGVLVDGKPSTPEHHAPQSVVERRKALALGINKAMQGDGGNRRRAQRVASSMPVSLWREGMGTAIQCTLIDKSSTGAKLDVEPDRYIGTGIGISVGERLTLTFYYAQERTSVFCDVMWIDGTRCGVRYYGQFHTELVKAKTPVKKRFGAAS